MKKTVSLLSLCFICYSRTLHAQNIDMPMSHLQELLCKKWVASYALMGEMRIAPRPGTGQISYDFKNDKTFLFTDQQGKTQPGTWNYDNAGKMVRLNLNGNKNTTIISLKEDELMMQVDTKKATPDDPAPIKMVYKVVRS